MPITRGGHASPWAVRAGNAGSDLALGLELLMELRLVRRRRLVVLL